MISAPFSLPTRRVCSPRISPQGRADWCGCESRATAAQLDDAVALTGAGGRGLPRYVLDRGHLVRRLDPVWGTDEQAKEADDDTFYYTKTAPWHERLNQRTWLAFEDHLVSNTNNRDLPISIFTGPMFCDCNVLYRGVRVPEEFWKVVVMVTPAGEPHCTAYLLSQREMLDDLEFQFGAFRTYQTPVHRIEAKTGLDFGRLKEFDPLAGTESLGGSPSLLLEDLESILI